MAVVQRAMYADICLNNSDMEAVIRVTPYDERLNETKSMTFGVHRHQIGETLASYKVSVASITSATAMGARIALSQLHLEEIYVIISIGSPVSSVDKSCFKKMFYNLFEQNYHFNFVWLFDSGFETGLIPLGEDKFAAKKVTVYFLQHQMNWAKPDVGRYLEGDRRYLKMSVSVDVQLVLANNALFELYNIRGHEYRDADFVYYLRLKSGSPVKVTTRPQCVFPYTFM